MKRYLALLATLCCAAGPALAAQGASAPNAQSSVVFTQEYSPMAHRLIARAEESILILMYFIIPAAAPAAEGADPVGSLIEALGDAHARGVRIRIVLEDGKAKENQAAVRRFVRLGIPVHYDTPASLLHTKAMVVDRSAILVGSANWSRAAFSKNQEISALMHAPEEARRIHALVDAMVLRPADALVPKGETIPLGEAFLLDPAFGPRLVAGNARKTFDVYVALLGKESPAPDRDARAQESRRKSLWKLEQFGLLKRLGRNKGAELLPLGPEAVAIPKNFWDHGWHRRLSLTGKYMYFVALREAARSTKNPGWFRSQEDLAKTYHVSDWTIGRGLRELEKANLLDIERSVSPGAPFGDRHANVYTMRAPYDPAELAIAMDALRREAGEQPFALAQEVAEILNDPNDAEVLRTVLEMIATHGRQRVRQAANTIKIYKAGSGLRSLKRLREEL